VNLAATSLGKSIERDFGMACADQASAHQV
jgi:hypothetical protein